MSNHNNAAPRSGRATEILELYCTTCGREMRHRNAEPTAGTVTRQNTTTCTSCYRARRRPYRDHRGAAWVDVPCIPIRTYLKPSTYKAYTTRANELKISVPELLSRIADRSVGAP